MHLSPPSFFDTPHCSLDTPIQDHHHHLGLIFIVPCTSVTVPSPCSVQIKCPVTTSNTYNTLLNYTQRWNRASRKSVTRKILILCIGTFDAVYVEKVGRHFLPEMLPCWYYVNKQSPLMLGKLVHSNVWGLSEIPQACGIKQKDIDSLFTYVKKTRMT